MSVRTGERIALVGRSGSGKTTLLSLLGLLDGPDSGSVTFAGRDVVRMTEDERANFRRTHVGLIFQLFHLIPALSALENVCAPLFPYRRRGAVEPLARELLDRLGLSRRMGHRPAQLSGGEQQRVAIARALINGPRLVLADEPTGNLDSQSAETVIELLLELQSQHEFALVIATHDELLATQMTRTVRLLDGRIAADM